MINNVPQGAPLLAAVAQFERDLLIERTQAGLSRAKSEGKTLGRPAKSSAEQVQSLKAQGFSQSEVVDELKISLSTVKRLWNKTA
jgi:putative DNA-invertase from lambdoid prophage Rac